MNDRAPQSSMRASVIGPLWPDSFADNIASGLRDLGITVTEHGAPHPKPRARLTAVALETAFRSHQLDMRWQMRLANEILDAAPDVVVSTDARLLPEAVGRMRQAGVRVAMWFPDCVANVGRFHMLAAEYDVLAFKDPLLVQRLRATYAANVRYLPEACRPGWHSPPVGVTPKPGPIAVVGNMYPSRLMLLRRLHDDGVPLQLFGSGFPRWSHPGPLQGLHTGEHVTGLRKAEVFRGASAVLNNLHPAEIDGVNARLFEATGCGALVLTESRPTLSSLFDDDEVVGFASYEELLGAARAAAAGDLPAKEFGDRASARAHAEHRYVDRLTRLLEWLT
ncbi:MAG: spore maturation protein CgeB [Mycobacterium sp.]|nr:spore maturation protein CgeB [Mycobacterium sp.]